MRQGLNLVFTLLLAAGLLFGQSAELSGFVKDPSGGTIMDASLELRNQDTGIRQDANTNTEGFYSFAGLKPGTYQATVQANKFRTLTRQAIILDVAERASLDFILQLAVVAQRVTVNTQSALLNSVDPAVSTVVDQQFVQNMPLNGRSFQSLIALTPGVVFAPVDYESAGIAQGQFSVNGQRSNANYFMVDGVSANFGTYPNSSVGQAFGGTVPGLSTAGTTHGLVSVDDMQEFRVQTSTYSPEYGRSPGAQISILTRSGTNQFYGTAFDYLRNDLFDARNFFDVPPLGKPPLRQNDFGGTIGGPIRKDKTFFFVSYEGLRLRLPQTDTGSFYTAAARANVAPAFKPLLAALPVPDGPLNPDGLTANLTVAYSNPSTLNATSLRLDHNFNSRVTLFARYHHAPSTSTLRFWSEVGMTTVDSDTATAGLTMLVTPRTLNEFRANWSRQTGGYAIHLDSFHGAVPPAASALYPVAYSTSDQFIFESPDGNEIRTGNQDTNTQRQWNFVDTFSIAAGTHQFKFGLDLRRLTPTTGFFNTFLLSGGSYADLQSGIADGAFQTAGSKISVRIKNYSSFAQDIWKASPRLTLTYGLRWEINTPPVSLTPGRPLYAVTGMFDSQPFGLAPAGTPLWHTRLNNFAPRAGAAWQLTPKTVLRGGFGLYYDLGIPGSVPDTINGFPYYRTNSVGPQPFNLNSPAYSPPPFSLVPGPEASYISAFDPHLRVPLTYQWNVTFQQALAANQQLSASYVGSYGRNLLRDDSIKLTSFDFPVFVTTNGDWSHYSALQVQFQRRMSKGLQALVSYTLAKSTDTNSTDVCGCTYTNSLSNVNPAADLGPSNFDVRNSFAAAISYQLPAPNTPFVNALLRDWTIDGIVRSVSALPFDILARGVSPVFGFYRARPDVVYGVPFYIAAPAEPGGRMLNSAAFSAPVNGEEGDLPRNYFRAFPINQTDIALSRRIQFTERTALYVRAEYFNVFNHPMFGPPYNSLGYGPLFGQAYQTLNNNLGGLNPLYQIGGPRSGQFTLKLLF